MFSLLHGLMILMSQEALHVLMQLISTLYVSINFNTDLGLIRDNLTLFIIDRLVHIW